MAVLNTTGILAGSSAVEDASDGVTKSLKFSGNLDEAKLERTNISQGNPTTWTVSFWMKRGNVQRTDAQKIFTCSTDTSNYVNMGLLPPGDDWEFQTHAYPSEVYSYSGGHVKDCAAWYHVTVATDTNQGEAAERHRTWINGVEQKTWRYGSNAAQGALTKMFAPGADIQLSGWESNTDNYFDGYLADFYIIDGLALNPGAFVSRDGAGVVQPIALNIPGANDGTTWSNNLTSSNGFYGGAGAAKAFNGTLSDGCATANLNQTLTFTPNGTDGITCNNNVEVYLTGQTSLGVLVSVNDGPEYPLTMGEWTAIPVHGGKLIKLVSRGDELNHGVIHALRVDGVLMVDGVTDPTTRNNPNNGTTWSNSMTGSANSGAPVTRIFDGKSLSGSGNHSFANNGNHISFIPSSTITADTKIEIHTEVKGSITGANDLKVNGTSIFNAVKTALGESTAGWYDIGTSIDSTDGIYFGREDTNNKTFAHAIRVDGHLLIDAAVDNTSHYKFDDTSNIGKDSINSHDLTATNITVTAPDEEEPGGPIWNTNSSGSTISSPAAYNGEGREGASSIVLALPGNSGDTSNGNYLDHALEIAGTGSTREVGTTGVGNTTSSPKWYGSCLDWQGDTDSTDKLLITDRDSDWQFGTGDFTIECWADLVERSSSDYQAIASTSSSDSNDAGWIFGKDNSGNLGWCKNSGDFSNAWILTISDDGVYSGGWHHLAICRASGTLRLFLDGSLMTSVSDSTNYNYGGDLVLGNRWNNGGGYPHGDGSKTCDYRIYKGYAKYTSAFTPAVGPSLRNEQIDTLNDSPSNTGEDSGNGGEVSGNYATLDPNFLDSNTAYTITEGNLKYVNGGAGVGSNLRSIRTNFPMTSGKWYCEHYCINDDFMVGVLRYDHPVSTYLNWSGGTGWGIRAGGQKCNAGSEPNYGSTYDAGDIVQIAFDADAGELYFGKNGTWEASSNPATGASPAFTGLTDGPYSFGAGHWGDSGIWNFGQRPFTYSAPSGYKCCCTQNLPDFAGANDNSAGDKNYPQKFFDIVKYNGNQTTRTFKNLIFDPDIVWFKDRSADSENNRFFDSIRGANNELYTNTGAAANTSQTNVLTAFTTEGWTLASATHQNENNRSYVAWCFNAGSTITPSSSYDITPTSQTVSTTAGFSMTQYEGAGSAASIPHALGKAPTFIIIKDIDNSKDWMVWTHKLDDNGLIQLNTTEATNTTYSEGYVDSVNANTVTFGSGSTWNNVNGSGRTYMMYAWTDTEGMVKTGRYIGNDTTTAQGPNINCGFKPKFIMTKCESDQFTGSDWIIMDTVRDKQNPNQLALRANLADDEQDYDRLDVYANGFRLLMGDGDQNDLNKYYVFLALAEQPFKTARGFALTHNN